MKLSRNHVLIVLACVLMLIAGARFWSQAAQQRSDAAAGSKVSRAGERITTTTGGPGGGIVQMHADPFADLGLTPDQRKKVDALIAASTETKTTQDGHGHVMKQVKVRIPPEKLHAILTPEQIKKLQAEAPHGRIIREGGGPGPQS